MKAIKPLHQIEKEYTQLELLVSVQNEPYRYNWLNTPIEENIQIILAWIHTHGESAKQEQLKHAFGLLDKYTAMLKKYYQNHPWRQ